MEANCFSDVSTCAGLYLEPPPPPPKKKHLLIFQAVLSDTNQQCTNEALQVETVITSGCGCMFDSLRFHFPFPFFSSKHHSTNPLGIAVAGSEAYTNSVLQHFVRVLLNKSLKQDFFRFFVIPLGKNSGGRIFFSYWSFSFRKKKKILFQEVHRNKICPFV